MNNNKKPKCPECSEELETSFNGDYKCMNCYQYFTVEDIKEITRNLSIIRQLKKRQL